MNWRLVNLGRSKDDFSSSLQSRTVWLNQIVRYHTHVGELYYIHVWNSTQLVCKIIENLGKVYKNNVANIVTSGNCYWYRSSLFSCIFRILTGTAQAVALTLFILYVVVPLLFRYSHKLQRNLLFLPFGEYHWFVKWNL